MVEQKSFSYDEAYAATLDYFDGDEVPAKTFVDKYPLKDNDNKIVEKTPDDLHGRIAQEFARIDADKYGLDFDERRAVYREAMDHFARIVPQGSPMAAIGNPYRAMSASNCVVVASPEDSIEGIFKTGLDLAQLYKRRCGVGIDISSLRPEGMTVNNAARTTSGAWSFAELYSAITNQIGQHGRRGASMITIDVHHPDVVPFAKMKRDKTKVTGANVSVKLSNEFMRAVENDTDYEQRWPLEGSPRFVRKVSARKVWDTIIESATMCAEPGVIMWGHMTENLPAHSYPQFKTVSTNPCSEIALSAYDSCRLISINLTAYVHKAFEPEAEFDYVAFRRDIRTAMQMADNLVDIELELIERIKDVVGRDEEDVAKRCTEAGLNNPRLIQLIAKKFSNFSEVEIWNKLRQAGEQGRRTGVGTHGLGDTLAQLCIRYDSEDALGTVDEIYRTLRDTAYQASIDLAKERGPFPAFDWETEKDNAYIKRLPEHLRTQLAEHGRRNISMLTQAPTGSVSMISKCGEFETYNISSGVEPAFRAAYVRRKKVNAGDENVRVDYTDKNGCHWQEFDVYHGNVLNYYAKKGIEIGKPLPDYFVFAGEIDGTRRIQIQGIEQQYIDHSISSTINLPRETEPATVADLYMKAWKHKLKGVTVYREGSRDGVLVSEEDSKRRVKELEERIQELEEQVDRRSLVPVSHAPRRPDALDSRTHKIKVDFGDGNPKNTYVTISFFPGTKRPYEIFLQAPLTGLDEKDLQILELTARSTSMNLRHGLPIQYICEQLDKVGGQYLFSIPTNIAKVLRHYIDPTTIEDIPIEEDASTTIPTGGPPSNSSGRLKCPDCGAQTYRLTGQTCGICDSCGYEKCG